MAQRDRTTCTLTVTWDGKSYDVDEVIEFDYSSDILAVGDECHVTVVNDRKKYTGKLQVGATVSLNMAHPLVNGGNPTLRHEGIITNRRGVFSPQGNLVKLTVADRGWHLMNSCAPLWYNLRKASLKDFIDPARYQQGRGGRKYFIDPSWGIKGVRYSNDENRNKKLGKVLGQRANLGVAQAAAAAQRVIDPVFAIQIEPGDTCLDKMIEVFRRENLLVNVSVDGYIQVWNPDYTQQPLYQLRCMDADNANNVESSEVVEDARTIWTDIECVGEQIGYEGSQDPNDPNATKKRGSFYNREALPFMHRLTFGDGEMFQRGLARLEAAWKYKRGIYDSWYAQYTTLDHHQGGTWYEADTMCSVEDDEHGLSGAFYVSQVRCVSSVKQGDTTTLILRKPGLLSASFGKHPHPPIIRSTAPARSQGKESQPNANTTTVNYTPADGSGGQSR